MVLVDNLKLSSYISHNNLSFLIYFPSLINRINNNVFFYFVAYILKNIFVCLMMRENINLTNLFLFRNVSCCKLIMLGRQRLIRGNSKLEWKACFSIDRADTFNSSKYTSEILIFKLIYKLIQS